MAVHARDCMRHCSLLFLIHLHAPSPAISIADGNGRDVVDQSTPSCFVHLVGRSDQCEWAIAVQDLDSTQCQGCKCGYDQADAAL